MIIRSKFLLKDAKKTRSALMNFCEIFCEKDIKKIHFTSYNTQMEIEIVSNSISFRDFINSITPFCDENEILEFFYDGENSDLTHQSTEPIKENTSNSSVKQESSMEQDISNESGHSESSVESSDSNQTQATSSETITVNKKRVASATKSPRNKSVRSKNKRSKSVNEHERAVIVDKLNETISSASTLEDASLKLTSLLNSKNQEWLSPFIASLTTLDNVTLKNLEGILQEQGQKPTSKLNIFRTMLKNLSHKLDVKISLLPFLKLVREVLINKFSDDTADSTLNLTPEVVAKDPVIEDILSDISKYDSVPDLLKYLFENLNLDTISEKEQGDIKTVLEAVLQCRQPLSEDSIIQTSCISYDIYLIARMNISTKLDDFCHKHGIHKKISSMEFFAFLKNNFKTE